MIVMITGTATAWALEKNVYVSFSDQQGEWKLSGYYQTVADALESNGYNLAHLKKKYEPSIPWEQKIKDGSKLTLTCKCQVKIIENGKHIKTLHTTKLTVGEMLKEQNIELTQYDEVAPKLEQKITDEMTVQIYKVERIIQKEVETIDYQVKKEKDDTLYEGEDKVVQEGKPGKKIYQITTLAKNGVPIVENGKPVTERKLVQTIKAQDKIIKIGTKEKKKEEKKEEKSDSESDTKGCRTMAAEVTAYTYYPGENITASGEPVRRGAIAVDPDVIPMHSRIYVPGYGWGEALDTGGKVKGNIIDVFMETRREAYDWGRVKKEIKVCPPANN